MKHFGIFLLIFMVFVASSNAYKIATIGLERQATTIATNSQLAECTDNTCQTEHTEQKLRLGLCAVPGFIQTTQRIELSLHNCERLRPQLSRTFTGLLPLPVKRPPKSTSFV